MFFTNSENPKRGILKITPLPADSMYRIETTKGKLLEFQQSKEGPDYQALARVEITQATDADEQEAWDHAAGVAANAADYFVDVEKVEGGWVVVIYKGDQP